MALIKVKIPLLVSFTFILAFLGIMPLVKNLLYPNTKTVYLTIKLSQGFWWVIASEPQSWYLSQIKPESKIYSLTGKPIAEVISINYYPASKEGRFIGYKTYVNLKVQTTYNPKTHTYYFKRNKLLVGAPIELTFPQFTLSATIVSISTNPPKPQFLTKTITLTKKFSYPWECQAIKIGDSMSDGQQTIFQVIDKSCSPTKAIFPDTYGNITANTLLPLTYITIKAKILVQSKNNQLIFAQEYPLTTNSTLPIITPQYNYSDAFISSIE